ncbi:MAG: hypothetical protein CVT84_00185 [Alphaproteobacteria bacterium HGW-Alphaproteobacteria-6]|nr:MAG: hypothetical protein CVT84_00185 [Alphaproteobacteria bacterium HGW-Alphaproteobacteria-6]
MSNGDGHVFRTNAFSCSTTPLITCFKETEISSATGFFYSHKDEVYLVTNWHVVSGRHADNLKPLDDKHGALPDSLIVPLPIAAVRSIPKPMMAKDPQKVPLYEDTGKSDAPERPLWLMHPIFRNLVDVAVLHLPLNEKEKPGFLSISVNSLERIPDLELAVATSVFVLGHPRGIGSKTPTKIPIWKRASVASEPDFNWDNVPCFLIDSATREGMSGAPVIGWHRGLGYPKQGGSIGGKTISGGRFFGIYSGRLGGDEFLAQLGRVWKAPVITEIIEGNVRGESSFFMSEKKN